MDLIEGSTRRLNARTVAGIALALVSCADGSVTDLRREVGEPWEVGGAVPETITVPLPSDGAVVTSLTTADRTAVMVTYPGARLAELAAFYDEELSVLDMVRSEHTIVAETEAVWMVRWKRTDLEVRVPECINLFTRQFSQVCVAVDQHPRSSEA